jgi:hypothetical protein
MAAKYLFAANELGVFAALPDDGGSLAEVAATTKVPPRTLRIVLDALVAVELLRGDGVGQARRYLHTPETREYLSGRTQSDLRPFLRFWDRLSYRGWTQFADAVRHGNVGIGGVAPTPEEMDILFEGVATINKATAESLADRYDFSAHKRLLDLGGGSGTFVIETALHHPRLLGTLFDIAADMARRAFSLAGISDRFAIVEGDFFADAIPVGHDVILMSSILHFYLEPQGIALLRRARQASAVGTKLLLVDFWLDATRTSPLFNAMMAGEFLVVEGGDSYSVDQAREWLAETGWRYESVLALEGPASALIASAVD